MVLVYEEDLKKKLSLAALPLKTSEKSEVCKHMKKNYYLSLLQLPSTLWYYL